MKETLVLTLLAADRPGLVEALSNVITSHGGNWEAGRMARLAGRFAGILLVTIEAERISALESALTGLSESGLRVSIDRGGKSAEPERRVRLDLVGQDRPGIIRDIASLLAARNVNVEELETSCESAPMTGEPLFRMRADVSLPASLDERDLRDTLEGLAPELMVDFAQVGKRKR